MQPTSSPASLAVRSAAPGPPIAVGAALGMLGSACLNLAFPPCNIWPMIFIAFAPMLLSDYRVARRIAG